MPHTHGAGEIQLDSRHQTEQHTHEAGTIELGNRQQLGSSDHAATPTSTLPCSYVRTGETLQQ